MAFPKKGALHQEFVPMVDSVDFATIESAVTASQFNAGTRKFYGMNTGGSAAVTSGAISKVASLVRSGVFRVTLKGTENNFDMMEIRIAGVTGCAEQIIQWMNVDNDDSDIMSALTVIQSMASDAASAAQQGNSRVLLVQSRLSDFDSRMVSDVSDIRSLLSDFLSDFQSRVPKAVATNSQLSDLHSDLRSFLVVMSGIQSDLYSQVSDFRSDLHSFVSTTGVQLNASSLSDLRSAITAGPAGVLTVSDISDIGSRVAAVLASDLSDILSAAVQTNSRVLLVQSRLSDFDSRIVSDFSDLRSFLSDFQSDLLSHLDTTGVGLNASTMSDLRSAVAGVTAAVSASDMSDIASRVDVLLASRLSDILSAAQQTNSRVLVVQSQTSDTYSLLSDLQSDFQSRVPKRVATDSQLSDLASDLKSAVTIVQSMASDAASAAQQGNSRILVVQSQASDLASKLSDVESNLLSLLTTTGVQLNTSVMSDIRSAVAAVTVNLTVSDISDIASAVAAAVTTITTSDISDIASRVDAVLASRLSDILSAAQQANSRVLLVQSQASDTYSLLSDLNSNFNSRVPLEPAGRSQLSDLASDLRSVALVGQSLASDAASAAQQANSRILVVQSHASDIYSLLSDVQSDFQSRVPKRVATDSQLSALVSDVISALAAGVPVSASDMSDIRSAIAAGTLTQSAISDIASAVAVQIASDLSDTLSGVRQANSRLLVAQSQASDIYSLLSDLHSDVGVLSGVVSDLDSALDAGVELGASTLSDLRSAITANGVLRAGAEPTGVIGHTDPLAAKVDWIAALARNKVKTTSTLQSLRNDADNDTIASAVVTDSGGSFVRGEWSS
jgi:hypothetical protein